MAGKGQPTRPSRATLANAASNRTAHEWPILRTMNEHTHTHTEGSRCKQNHRYYSLLCRRLPKEDSLSASLS